MLVLNDLQKITGLVWRTAAVAAVTGCASFGGGDAPVDPYYIPGAPDVIVPQRPPARPQALIVQPAPRQDGPLVPPPFDMSEPAPSATLQVLVNGRRVGIPLARNGEAIAATPISGTVAGRPVSDIRNPSFQTRLPVPARATYTPMSSAELSRRVEIGELFQNGSTDWAGNVNRSLDRAAAILRSNPRVSVLVSGYAYITEPGGRALAVRRADALAQELSRRGVGRGRIQTEGRLVVASRNSTADLEAIKTASRKAQIRITSGLLTDDPFRQGVPGF